MLVCILLLVSSDAVFANSNDKKKDKVPSNIHYKILTKEEAIKRVSEIDGISLEDAKKKVSQADSQDKVTALSGYTYAEYYTTKKLGAGYEVEVGSVVRMATGGGYSNFDTIISSWSVASGSGSYTWNKFHVSNQILNAGQLLLNSRGALEVKVDTSTTAGAQAGSELLGASFSVSSTVGTTTYYRKTETIKETITLSWWR
ncbi:hypothetical protein M1437_00010 [Patescibacteria group bacterium]|nr:hypothetical protein [Patescibacteria group bacterium]